MPKNIEQADIEIFEEGQAFLLYGRSAKGKAVAQSIEGPVGPDGADRIVDRRVLLNVVGRLLSLARVSVGVFPKQS